MKVAFHFKMSSLATLQFQGIQNEQEGKHLRGSGEIAKKEKDWKKIESKWRDRWKLYKDLKLGYDFYWSNLKSYPHLRCCAMTLV